MSKHVLLFKDDQHNIDGVVARKMAYNASRPHKHGKAY